MPERSKTQTATFNAGIWPHLVAYALAAALYVIAAWVPGIPLPTWPGAGCLWCAGTPASADVDTAALLTALWAFHFGRRIFETVALFSFQRARSFSEVFAFVWYGAWAFWMGVAHRGALPSWPVVAAGTAAFLAGEAGNCACHVMLVQQRSAAQLLQGGAASGLLVGAGPGTSSTTASGHVIPRGFAFEWLVAPHYTFELVAWLGWFVAAGSLPALLFAALSFATMAPRAVEADRRYRAEFGGAYAGLRRRIFVPGVW
jgi:protein-S-isoprenylcysteine O-methyltransferase Ste14